MTTKFFKNIETLEDLKTQYRALAIKNHPDRGGDVVERSAKNGALFN